MSFETFEISVCTDCILVLANGSPYAEGSETPETEAREKALTAYEEKLAEDGAHLTSGSDDLGFSWSPCEACGSALGGDRHQAFELHPESAV